MDDERVGERGNGWGRMGRTEECTELMFWSCSLKFRHLIGLGLLLYVRSRLDFGGYPALE